MIIHQREITYGKRNYQEFFESLIKLKSYMEEKFPEISVELMYNLAGQRGFATVQIRYPSLAEYERIDAEADKDEMYNKLLEHIVTPEKLPVDQFYRVIRRG